MSDIRKFKSEKALLEAVRIPSLSRHVLIRTINKNEEATTPSGILKVADTEWHENRHANRMGVVVACSKRIPFEVEGDLSPWDTPVQVTPGWIVYIDYLQGLNCDVFVTEEGEEYRLLNYDDLNVALTERFEGEDFDEQVTKDGLFYVRPLNGFHLFERVYDEKHKFAIDNVTTINKKYGIVRYVAANNRAYENGLSEDHLDLKVGDKVLFGQVPEVMLEDEMHCSFDGGTMYRRSQSRNIEMVWRDGRMILPNGRLLVKPIKEEEVRKSGIILPKADKLLRNHRAKVVISSHGEIVPGQEVKYTKGGGELMDYDGEKHRILRESNVLYVE